MNTFKAFVALACFSVAVLVTQAWQVQPSLGIYAALMLSGLIGLNIGDIFLLEAFRRLGAARTLMIFSFQPILISVAAYYLFNEALEFKRIYAIGILLICVFIVSFERYKEMGRWEWAGPLIAIAGVSLDTIGVLITRYSFESTPGLSAAYANFIRCVGAGLGFAIMLQFKPAHLWEKFRKFDSKNKLTLLIASIAGTFLSLWLYLKAIDLGPLGPVNAIAGCVPLFSAIFECLYYRKLPSAYLVAALSLFSVGLWILAS